MNDSRFGPKVRSMNSTIPDCFHEWRTETADQIGESSDGVNLRPAAARGASHQVPLSRICGNKAITLFLPLPEIGFSPRYTSKRAQQSAGESIAG